ncbi:class I SAM-dependent methyltransferase [Clostridium kluyveri]|uniref:class I SAM-dependent methyltransferase n=1 Tax=Clostridium kluyveri TaxID=1534 RepID=UPI002246CA85|nr:methyltransferase domain-containing protein [Clostridium kluyveri]UZQ48895.1 methyltransferase domain-containing protein [Clostridium kluyveri]
MNNLNNKKIYKRWAGKYDMFFGSQYINKQRETEISMLNLKSGDKILFIGIGTGEDLRFIPEGVSVTGIDITEEMLDVARIKAKDLHLKDIKILNMDGQNLDFNDNQFDYVVLNLILSVIPDGNKCLSEAYRVLKDEGKIAVFDKFIEDKEEPNFVRKLLNNITKLLGTDINRRFSDILGNINLKIIEERKSILGGTYKIFILKKC